MSLSDDLRRGWSADIGTIMVGALMALAVSGPLAIVMALLTTDSEGVIVVIAALVQAFLTFFFAGRRAAK